MIRKSIGIVLSVGILFWLVGSAAAADVAKIGVVDFQRILDHSSPGKAAQALINKKAQQWEKDLEAKRAVIQKESNELQKDALVISQDVLQQKQRDIRIKTNDLKQLEQDYSQAARQLQMSHIQGIRSDIIRICQKIGQQEGYLLIVEKKEAGVIYIPASVDITDRVIKIYNAEFAKGTAG